MILVFGGVPARRWATTASAGCRRAWRPGVDAPPVLGQTASAASASSRCAPAASATDPAGLRGPRRAGQEPRGHDDAGTLATLEDVGNVAAFVASDRARTMTAATVNVSCGALID